MNTVIIESPFKGRGKNRFSRYRDQVLNEMCARSCLRDCLNRGEAPFASHALYTLVGVLDDSIEKERNLGIQAGLAIGDRLEKTAVYIDRGLTHGMLQGIDRARDAGRKIEFRSIHGASISQEVDL